MTQALQVSPGASAGAARLRPRMLVAAVLGAGLSGAFMASCYWPLDLHFIAWVALVPWLLVLPRLTPGRAWLYGTIVGLVFYRIGLAWLFKLHGPLGGLTAVGLSLLMGFSFRVARLLMHRFGESAMLWAAPLTFVGQEVLRCEGLGRYRFAFLAWGYSQAHNLWIAQIASIGGVYFVSFLVVAVNAAIAYGLARRSIRSWGPAALIGVAVLILAVVSQPRMTPASPPIAAACVQAESFEFQPYIDLTSRALNDPARPAFVVLPEHTISHYASAKHPLIRALAALAREHNAFLCIGVHTRPARRGRCEYDNVGMLIGPDGRILVEQSKAVPIAFADDGNPGCTQETIDTPYGRVGIYVCYDGTFTDIPRRLQALGAQLLLAPCMDPERWPTQEREQHADMAPFRSIELRRPAIRAFSAGVSQIIDAGGRVLAQRSKQQGPGVICARVFMGGERTVFARGGHWFGTVAGVAFLGIVVVLTFAEWFKAAGRLVSRAGLQGAAVRQVDMPCRDNPGDRDCHG